LSSSVCTLVVVAQSRGFGTGRQTAPTTRAASASTLRLIPISATAAAPAVTLVRITTGLDGGSALGDSTDASISADGRFVTFRSVASNLVADGPHSQRDVFVYDRVTGQTTRESIGADGASSNQASFTPVISAGGRFVAFQSLATNLVSPPTEPGIEHIYVRDRQLRTTTLVDVSTAGSRGSANALEPAITSDGRFVAFASFASNLVNDDVNGCGDVFVHDMATAITERASIPTPGFTVSCTFDSRGPSLSADGRYVAFNGAATSATPGSLLSVYLRDRAASQTSLVSVDANGQPFRDFAGGSSMSADGRFIAFQVSRPNSGADTGLYVRDRAAGRTLGPLPGVFITSRVSADGRFVSYLTLDHQAFVVDASSGVVTPIATDVSDLSAVAGGAVAFSTRVSKVASDADRFSDVYVATIASDSAPGAPQGLAATVFGSTLTLTWGAPASGSPPTAYVIEAGSASGGVDIANFSTGSTATTFSATVAGGGTFFIRVRAAGAAGVSAPSNEILVTIGSGQSPPGAPVGLSSSVSGSTVTLTWARPLSGDAATTYIVEAGSSSGASNLAVIDTQSTNPIFVAPGVGTGTYFVRVRAANAAGAGPVSNEVVVVVP
jgi:Tol biopolymer transport system component